MELEFYKIQKLPPLNIGDIKNNVESCKLRVVSHREAYVYAVEITYMDNRKEEYVIKAIGTMLAYDVMQKTGYTTSSWTFPIQTFTSKEEIEISIGLIPYNEIASGKVKAAILQLQKQEIKQKFLGEEMVVYEVPLLSFNLSL